MGTDHVIMWEYIIICGPVGTDCYLREQIVSVRTDYTQSVETDCKLW